MQLFDSLTSTCDRVTLVNAEVTKDRIMCGFAFIGSYCRSPIMFAGIGAITLQDIHTDRPNSITLSSEHDDIEFLLTPYGLQLQAESSSQDSST